MKNRAVAAFSWLLAQKCVVEGVTATSCATYSYGMTWPLRTGVFAAGVLFAAGNGWSQDPELDQARAGVAIVSAEPSDAVEMKVLDPRNDLGQAELIERLQNVVWTERQAPQEGVPPAVASSMFTTMFQAVAGGGSGSQDLARLRTKRPE